MKTILRDKNSSSASQNERTPYPEKAEINHIPDSKHKSSTLRKITAFAVILVIFFFLGKTLYHNIGEISTYQWNIKPLPLIVSFLLLIVNLAISAFAWGKILLLFGARLPFGRSFKIMSLSGMGKYLPGKIWLYLSQIYLSRKANISKSVCVFSLLLLFASYNLAGILVFLFSLFFWKRFSPVAISAFLFACGSLFLIIFSPRILNRILRTLTFITNKFKQGLIPAELTFRGGASQIGQIILILLVDWTIFGAGIYFLINSFYNINLSQTVILCGIFAISSIVGIFSFFVPAGLGVREGVLSYLLSMFVPISVAILISLVMRIWMTLGELFCFFIALKIKKPEVW
jgi:uncharacterized membrane protein YbhN (UPF0104 family)